MDQTTFAPPASWPTPTPPPPAPKSHTGRNIALGVVGALTVLGLISGAVSGRSGSKPLSSTAQVYAVSINNETTCAGITGLRDQFADQQAAAVKAMNANIKAGGDGGLPYQTASDIAAIKPLIDRRLKDLCG